MAWAKSFRIHPEYGVSDKDIRAFLEMCEENAIIQVTTTYIPGGMFKGHIVDPRLNIIVTKLDDIAGERSSKDKQLDGYFVHS